MIRSTTTTAALLALVSVSAEADEVDEVFFQVRPSLVQLVGAGSDNLALPTTAPSDTSQTARTCSGLEIPKPTATGS